jgi:hypothetical protein
MYEYVVMTKLQRSLNLQRGIKPCGFLWEFQRELKRHRFNGTVFLS